MHEYTIILDPDELEGGYTVTVPALPGVVTQGETVEECIARAKEVIAAYIEDLVACGASPPRTAPSDFVRNGLPGLTGAPAPAGSDLEPRRGDPPGLRPCQPARIVRLAREQRDDLVRTGPVRISEGVDLSA